MAWRPREVAWPHNILIKSSSETKAETKMTKEIVNVGVERPLILDDLIKKFNVWKVLCVCAWIKRFIMNCRPKIQDPQHGPLRAGEIKNAKKWWIKQVQNEAKSQPTFPKDALVLNL